MRRSVPAGIAFFLAILVTVSGCGKGNFSQKTSAGKANIFRYSLVTNPTHVDPALVQDGDTIDLTQQIFEGLVKWDENSQVVPNLAEKWDITNGGTVYTFKIRKGITFSNGKPVTANDFKWSIERATNPALRSETALDYLGDIVGVEERVKSKSPTPPEVKGLTVVDDYTLRVQIDKPKPYFLGKLTYPCAFVVSKDAASPIKEMLRVEEMIGTGPFIAKRYVEDQTFDFVANKSYHEGAPSIDGIERPILKDAAVRLDKYKAGEVDLVQLERRDIPALKADPELGPQVKTFDRPATYYLAFNTKIYPPFAKREVRQAFAEAVDCKEICDKTLNGLNKVAYGVLAPKVLGYRGDGTKHLSFDPVGAKNLLAAAGFPNGAGLPPLDLFYRADREDVQLVAQAIQGYLSKNLNVTVNLKPLEWTTYLEKNNRKELPMYHMRWSADYLDPQDFLSLMLTTNGPENKQNYSNPQVDALCAAADVMPEKDPKRLALYAQAEDIALQDAAWLPIYYQSDSELISPRVQGLRESVFGHLPHTKVSLKN